MFDGSWRNEGRDGLFRSLHRSCITTDNQGKVAMADRTTHREPRRITRQNGPSGVGRGLNGELRAINERIVALRAVDSRKADGIIDYDDGGLPRRSSE
jgi:hypothetical protein